MSVGQGQALNPFVFAVPVSEYVFLCISVISGRTRPMPNSRGTGEDKRKTKEKSTERDRANCLTAVPNNSHLDGGAILLRKCGRELRTPLSIPALIRWANIWKPSPPEPSRLYRTSLLPPPPPPLHAPLPTPHPQPPVPAALNFLLPRQTGRIPHSNRPSQQTPNCGPCVGRNGQSDGFAEKNDNLCSESWPSPPWHNAEAPWGQT